MRSNVSELVEKINAIAKGGNLAGLSRLELDLLQQYLRSLYEEVEQAKTGHQLTHTPKVEHPIVNEPKEETVQPELLLAEVSEPVQEEKVVVQEPAPKEEKKETKEEKPAKSSLNEIIKSSGGLNEKLKPTSKEIHHSLSRKPIKDLVDLNKRIVLVNELFKGDAEAFTTAIGNIERVGDYEGAQQYINEHLLPKYNWNESAQSTRLFFKLVRQSFGVE
ncbi:MAG: hypothetical protein U0V74_04550 [Chitinophagales bacterium]